MRLDEMKKKWKERFTKEKMKEFVAKRGFYVLLLICLLGAAAGAIIISGSDQNPGDSSQASPSPTGLQAGANKDEPLTAAQEKHDQLLAQASASTTPSLPATSVSPTPAPKKLTLPVDGTLIRPFSMDKPLYNSTLDVWSVHKGIDISAKEGTAVKAALDGTVSDIKSDALMGHMLVITGSDGAKTVYASLSKRPDLKVGDKIKAGQNIGAVGKSASFEVMDGAHLHFEYIVGGKYINPEKYLVKQPAMPSPTPTPSSMPSTPASPKPLATPMPSGSIKPTGTPNRDLDPD